jgi:hypothetical protein
VIAVGFSVEATMDYDPHSMPAHGGEGRVSFFISVSEADVGMGYEPDHFNEG